MEFVQKSVRVDACTSRRFDPSFDFSNRTPSSAAASPSLSQLASPSSHHVTLILFLPLSCYLTPLIIGLGQTVSWPPLPAWSSQSMGNIMKFATHLSQRIIGAARLSLRRGGRGGRDLALCLNDECTCNCGCFLSDWVASLYPRACRFFVLLNFSLDWLQNSWHLCLC